MSDTTELLALLRLQCLIEPTNVDYTDSVLLRELYNSLTTKFERMVLDAHANYWIQNVDVATTAGLQEHRLPPRAIGVSKVELGYSSAASTGFVRLPQTSEDHIDIFQSAANSRGTPQRFVMRGDRVFLDPPPDSSGYILRIWYYVRPNRLTPVQSVANVPVGTITTITASTRTINMNQIPVSYSTAGAQTSFGSPQTIDIIGQGGWRELQVVNEPAIVTGVGNNMQFTNTSIDLSSVQLGDVVRAADQSEWPQIPEDYHRCLADISSIKILVQRDYQQKASGYGQDVSADMQRFQLMIAARVQEEVIKLRADLPSLRSGRYWGGYR
jgi:hypothetical protein